MKILAAKLALAALYPVRIAVWQSDFRSAALRAAEWRRRNNVSVLSRWVAS